MIVQPTPIPIPAVRHQRAVRLLMALRANPQGLLLSGAMAELGEAGRSASGANVTMLKALRERTHVDYLQPRGRPSRPGRTGGTYVITPAGTAWLAKEMAGLEGGDEVDADSTSHLSTGAMAGDRPITLLSKACAGQAPPGGIASVFDLGERV